MEVAILNVVWKGNKFLTDVIRNCSVDKIISLETLIEKLDLYSDDNKYARSNFFHQGFIRYEHKNKIAVLINKEICENLFKNRDFISKYIKKNRKDKLDKLEF